jgi:hypothetical protein
MRAIEMTMPPDGHRAAAQARARAARHDRFAALVGDAHHRRRPRRVARQHDGQRQALLAVGVVGVHAEVFGRGQHRIRDRVPRTRSMVVVWSSRQLRSSCQYKQIFRAVAEKLSFAGLPLAENRFDLETVLEPAAQRVGAPVASSAAAS